jgi:methyl-accepting chemotaxis protein
MRFGLKLFYTFLSFSTVVSALFALALYVFVFRKAEDDLKAEIQNHAFSLARTMGAFIDGDLHETIRSREDEKSEAYRSIQGVLRRFRDMNRDEQVFVQYAYTKVRTGPDSMLYVVDAQEDDGSIARIDPDTKDTTYNFTPVGMTSPIRWQKDFNQASVSDFYSDRWGTWITGSSPILNSHGEVVAFAYVDIDGKKVQAELSALKHRILIVSLLALLVLGGASAVLSFMLADYINRPVHQLHDGLMRMQEGVFDHTVDIRTGDEFQELGEAFNKMAANMRSMAAQISLGSKKIADSSTEVLSISQEQATTSSQQSVSVTETTATMEELSSTSRYIAENSESVVKIAAETQDISQKAFELSQTAKEKMEEIRRKSEQDSGEITELSKKMQKISEVMEIINDITDQTKLISFNAALEATGAGEAGKRFSVVAAEIRRLAENVAESTEEIKATVTEIRTAMDALVKSSRENSNIVREGVEIFNKVAAVLEGIVAAAENTTEAAKQISLSTQQQRTASEQVVTTLKEISEGARHFVKSSNQAATIAADLNSLSEDLKKTLAEFKVNGAQG